MSFLASQRFAVYAARLTAIMLAFWTCQLATAGVSADRARPSHPGRSAGKRLSSSRSGFLGCELVVRDSSPPGGAVTPVPEDVPSAHRPLELVLVATPAPAPPPASAGTSLSLLAPAEPSVTFATAFLRRGPPRH